MCVSSWFLPGRNCNTYFVIPCNSPHQVRKPCNWEFLLLAFALLSSLPKGSLPNQWIPVWWSLNLVSKSLKGIQSCARSTDWQCFPQVDAILLTSTTKIRIARWQSPLPKKQPFYLFSFQRSRHTRVLFCNYYKCSRCRSMLRLLSSGWAQGTNGVH